jgi:hypothetical protein
LRLPSEIATHLREELRRTLTANADRPPGGGKRGTVRYRLRKYPDVAAQMLVSARNGLTARSTVRACLVSEEAGHQ